MFDADSETVRIAQRVLDRQPRPPCELPADHPLRLMDGWARERNDDDRDEVIADLEQRIEDADDAAASAIAMSDDLRAELDLITAELFAAADESDKERAIGNIGALDALIKRTREIADQAREASKA